MRDLKEELQKAFVKVETLEQLKAVVSESYFDSKAQQFDDLNQQLILRYESLLKVFESLLNGKEKKLVQPLSSLPQLLYWRKREGV